MGRKILIFVCVIAGILVPNIVQAQEDDKIDVGLYILNLGRLDISTGAFTADFYLSLQCEDV